MQPSMKYMHLRYGKYDIWQEGNQMVEGLVGHPCGGVTLCYQVYKEEKWVRFGVALCSVKDNYNKKIGRAISKARMLNSDHVHVLPIDYPGDHDLLLCSLASLFCDTSEFVDYERVQAYLNDPSALEFYNLEFEE